MAANRCPNPTDNRELNLGGRRAALSDAETRGANRIVGRGKRVAKQIGGSVHRVDFSLSETLIRG